MDDENKSFNWLKLSNAVRHDDSKFVIVSKQTQIPCGPVPTRALGNVLEWAKQQDQLSEGKMKSDFLTSDFLRQHCKPEFNPLNGTVGIVPNDGPPAFFEVAQKQELIITSVVAQNKEK